jgi:CRP-like cAMP-binding protein
MKGVDIVAAIHTVNLPVESLLSCALFESMTTERITDVLNQTSASLTSYPKETIIALEGEPCHHVSIVLSGQIVVKKLYGSGKSVTVATMVAGNIFGEVMVYADQQTLPSTIMSQTDVTLLEIPRNDILTLCRLDPLFLENFLRMLSNKVWMLNEKLKLLSYGSIRQKITGTLLDLYRKHGSVYLMMDYNRQELADQLGIPRPSLSRELAQMRSDGLIDYWMNHVRIMDLDALENIMME